MFTDITLAVASVGCLIVSIIGNLSAAQDLILSGVILLIAANAIADWLKRRSARVASQ